MSNSTQRCGPPIQELISYDSRQGVDEIIDGAASARADGFEYAIAPCPGLIAKPGQRGEEGNSGIRISVVDAGVDVSPVRGAGFWDDELGGAGKCKDFERHVRRQNSSRKAAHEVVDQDASALRVTPKNAVDRSDRSQSRRRLSARLGHHVVGLLASAANKPPALEPRPRADALRGRAARWAGAHWTGQSGHIYVYDAEPPSPRALRGSELDLDRHGPHAPGHPVLDCGVGAKSIPAIARRNIPMWLKRASVRCRRSCESREPRRKQLVVHRLDDHRERPARRRHRAAVVMRNAFRR